MGPELNFLRPGDCLRSMTMLEKYMEKLGQSLGYSILTMESMDVWKTNMFNQDINHCISWESSCLIVTHMVSNA